MKPKNPVNIIRNVITYITVFIAIGYVIYLTFNSDKCTTNEYMILLLLTLIATTFVLELLDDERKWKEIKKDVHTEISAVSNSVIWKYEKTSDWVAKIKDLMSGGFHTFDSAALDKATRSKAKPQYSSIWGLLNDCSADSNITFRHVLRIRKNNLERLLKRISEGSAQKNSYFSVYELPSEFSFPTFGIIDSRYICTRSPYEQGESPCYMIIDDEDISRFFVNYFDYLWRESTKIEKITILEKYMEKFDYNEQEKVKLREIIDQIKKEGIIDDI